MSDESKYLHDSSEVLGWNCPPKPDCKVKIYDFRRPDKFSADQIQVLHTMHETFTRSAETAFSAICRKPCSIKLHSIDQLTYEEFIASIPDPCTSLIGKMTPLKGNILMQLDAPIGELVLERTFGGTGTGFGPECGNSPEDVTEIEQGAWLLVMRPVAAALKKCWDLIGLDFTVGFDSAESRPRNCQIVPPIEMIVLASMEFSSGNTKGYINIVYPYLTIEPVVNRLSTVYWYSSYPKSVISEEQKKTVYTIPVPVALTCEAETLTVEKIRSLKTGSLVSVPGWDEMRGALRTQDTVVAKVKLSPESKKGVYLASAQGTSQKKMASPPVGTTGEDIVRKAVENLESSVNNLNATLGGAIAALTGEVKKIEHRQEDLGDRLMFSQNDESALRAKPVESLGLNGILGNQTEMLSLLLCKERNQLSALVLSLLEDGTAARVLEGLASGEQPDIMKRVGAMEYVNSDIVETVEAVLMEKMQCLDERAPRAGGVDKVVGILNKASRATERSVIVALSASDHDFAENIKRNMFVFEDIVLLDDASLREVIKKVPKNDIVLALKGCSPEATKQLLDRFDGLGQSQIRNDLAASGRIRLAEVESAGQRVVEAVKALEEEGRIFIERGGED